jgi:hypothetical protein
LKIYDAHPLIANETCASLKHTIRTCESPAAALSLAARDVSFATAASVLLEAAAAVCKTGLATAVSRTLS